MLLSFYSMEEGLKKQLITLARQYEIPAFISEDPIQIPHRYHKQPDIEISALITSWIATGNRKAIIKSADKIDRELFKGNPYLYIIEKSWEEYKGNAKSFYRYYSHHDFYRLCATLFSIYQESENLEEYLDHSYTGISPLQRLQSTLGHVNGMPELTSSSEAKKMCMFLRWMIRQDSPVDLGVWKKFEADSLIIPLDTHVHRIATNLGLTKDRKCIKTACSITNALREIWPNDPVKGDFALFGYGVNESMADRAFITGKNKP